MKASRLKTFYKSIEKKSETLGMNFHRARRILVNSLLREYFKNDEGLVLCGRCQKIIAEDDAMHIDHREPWMMAEDPLESYFRLSNIQAAHAICNIKAGRKEGRREPFDYSVLHKIRAPKTGRFEKG